MDDVLRSKRKTGEFMQAREHDTLIKSIQKRFEKPLLTRANNGATLN